MNLPSLRKQIDRLDRQILRLLNRRAGLVGQVGQVKRLGRIPVVDRTRERIVLRQIQRANHGLLPQRSIRKIYEEILRQSRRLMARSTRR